MRQEIRLNPAEWVGASAEDVLDSVEYMIIKLDKKDFRINRLEKMEIVDDHIFIFDNWQGAIFVFRINGDFVSRIENLSGKWGRGAKFKIGSFTIDSKRNLVIVESTDDNDNFFYQFTYDGKFISILPKPRIYHSSFKVLNNGNYLFYQNPPYKIKDSVVNNMYHVIEYDSLMQLSNHYIPSDTSERMDVFYDYVDNIFMSGDNNSVYVTNYYSYELYDISNKNNINSYMFVLPLANSISKKYMDRKGSIEFVQYLKQNEKIIFGFNDIYRVDNNLFIRTLSAMKTHLIGEVDNIFAYNLHSKILLSLNKIQPSKISHNIPLFYDSRGVISVDRGFVYTYFLSSELTNLGVKLDDLASGFIKSMLESDTSWDDGFILIGKYHFKGDL